jgi:hypothetical protein
MVKHLPALSGRLYAVLCNENQNGNEQPFMCDPHFLKELDGLIDTRIPLAWGTCFGTEVAAAVTGGSWIAHHSDRGRTPGDNRVSMAAAMVRYGKPVVDREPVGLAEPGTPGQRYWDVNIAAALGAAAKTIGGGILHNHAGLWANPGMFGQTHRAGAAAYAAAIGAGTIVTPPPPPPPGPTSVLDIDMTIDHLWYPVFVHRSEELEAAISVEYSRLHGGNIPARSDIWHQIWRACIERGRWKTMRNALNNREG